MISPAAMERLTAFDRDKEGPHLVLRISCWAVALGLGAGQAWATRFSMYPDGISYLDIGDAYWRGDWHNAINAYWSPFYSLVVGFFVNAIKPSPYWEYSLVHLVNFLIYVAALGCFESFLSTFMKQQKERGQELAADNEMGLPGWAWFVMGYSAFVISSLFLITISFISGDMIIAAIIYIAAALILKIRNRNASSTTFIWLGLALGVGYLAKTAMLLISVPFLVIAIAAQRNAGKSMKRAVIAVLAFVLTASPFVFLLSKAKGRLTFGDSGKINYEINVNTGQVFIPQEKSATHPMRKIAGLADAYEYATPVSGTYPPWYDPSYWHEGIQARFDLVRQVRTLGLSTLECFWISCSLFQGAAISSAIFFLYLVAPDISGCIAYARGNWQLWIPAAAGIGLYALVVIEARYVAAFFCLLWMTAFSGVRLPISVGSVRLIKGASLTVAALTCVIAAVQIGRWYDNSEIARRHVATPICWKLADALRASGLRHGDKIAVISDWLFPAQEASYIARLARIQIIAQAPPAEFWADAPTRMKLGTVFVNAGAKAILTYMPPKAEAGWERLPGTDYYLYRFNTER